VKSLENTCHTWALLRWWFTTKRRYIKCVHLYLTFTFTSSVSLHMSSVLYGFQDYMLRVVTGQNVLTREWSGSTRSLKRIETQIRVGIPMVFLHAIWEPRGRW